MHQRSTFFVPYMSNILQHKEFKEQIQTSWFQPAGLNDYINIFGQSMCPQSCRHMDRVKRIWYLSPMRAAKVQASLRIRAVSPEPSLLAHASSESRETFRQKARSLAPLNGWACAVKICHDGMLEDTNSLDGAHISLKNWNDNIQTTKY